MILGHTCDEYSILTQKLGMIALHYHGPRMPFESMLASCTHPRAAGRCMPCRVAPTRWPLSRLRANAPSDKGHPDKPHPTGTTSHPAPPCCIGVSLATHHGALCHAHVPAQTGRPPSLVHAYKGAVYHLSVPTTVFLPR
jgi:hypothetical protein